MLEQIRNSLCRYLITGKKLIDMNLYLKITKQIVEIAEVLPKLSKKTIGQLKIKYTKKFMFQFNLFIYLNY